MPTTGRNSDTPSDGEGRLGEIVLGLAAIVGGVAVVVATLAGADLGPVVLLLVSLAVAAWGLYLAFRRPRVWRVGRR
jgi:hypothetical protein